MKLPEANRDLKILGSLRMILLRRPSAGYIINGGKGSFSLSLSFYVLRNERTTMSGVFFFCPSSLCLKKLIWKVGFVQLITFVIFFFLGIFSGLYARQIFF